MHEKQTQEPLRVACPREIWNVNREMCSSMATNDIEEISGLICLQNIDGHRLLQIIPTPPKELCVKQ